ncbi:ATP-grasp domain-containing protein [Steroidobacter flavus]|uniref:ATP-grasp domain-containing protein n=1 Tax=Steroidobacter flavus TaxID=1842136 RepID=A0ABV8T0P1_9GAMM
MKTLLFTGGGGAGSEALNRLFGSTYRVHFADADIEARPATVASTQWHSIPMAAAPSFIPRLQELCRELRVDVLVPGVDEELPRVARERGGFDCDVLLPPVEFIETHLDKLASNSALRAADLPAPLTEQIGQRSKIKFPCIAKPRSGRGSRGVAIVRSEEELSAHIVISRRPAEDFILQELLEGQEYTVMMSADRNGILRAVVPVRVGVKRGITLRAQTDNDAAVVAACRAIHDSAPVPGCYNIQLIKDANGAVKPFEINPRISTTACLALAAGVDFVAAYLSAEAAPASLAQFRDDIGLKRSWHNEFVYQR